MAARPRIDDDIRLKIVEASYYKGIDEAAALYSVSKHTVLKFRKFIEPPKGYSRGTKANLTKKQYQIIIKRSYEIGLTATAKELGIAKSTISRLRQLNAAPKGFKKIFHSQNDEQKRREIAEFSYEYSAKEAAEEYSVHISTVVSYRKKYPIDTFPKQAARLIEREKIKKWNRKRRR